MISPAFAAHRAAASGIFSFFCLLTIALSAGDPRLFAVSAGVSLLSAFLFTRGFAAGLSAFASPLAMMVDQALLWAAVIPMGGGQSLFALLLPVGVALAWQLEGKAAARFYAVLSVAGLAALLTLGALPLSTAGLLPLLLTGLAAPALLVALEAASGRRTTREGEEAAPLVPAQPEPAQRTAAESPARRGEEAILHDLKSPLSVMRVYTDLIAEGARRGELPNAEHLTNLSREIELAEKLMGLAATARPVAEEAGAQARIAPPAAEIPGASADLVEILG